jgi:hypothetical protein
MQCPQNMMRQILTENVDVGSFAAPIVNLELLLETIPKVDAKPEAKKNNTTIDIAGKVGFDLNDAFNGTLTECRPDASDLPNIVMIDNADIVSLLGIN